jgi:probable H4MPT-linked C1 transfer pathway protein
MDVIGLDIGGANLKAVHTSGGARLRPFALWKDPAGLPGALRELVSACPPFHQLAVTMTGELCDCYESKRQGVNAILDAVETVAGAVPVRVWHNDGRFVDVAAARKTPLQVAASNWLALATFACRYTPRGPALLLDIGSTTTDILPLHDGLPVPVGRTDPERLGCHELIYTGVRRTPVCALLGSEGAAELFATTLDVFLVLGAVAQDPTDTDTADGRPATVAAAHARLARMLCADLETTTAAQRRLLAGRVLQRQLYLLTSAVDQVAQRLPGPPQTVLLSGSGEFLARLVLMGQQAFPPCRAIFLSEALGQEVSAAACALAVATLAAEAGG